MAEKVIGSSFEASLRALIILDVMREEPLDEMQICAIDFIAVYAADFGLQDKNLHGYGRYRYSEYPGRKFLISEALKYLCMNGIAEVLCSANGFIYKITDSGEKICRSMENRYAKEYQIAVQAVVGQYGVDEREMLHDITKNNARFLRECDNEQILY